MVPAPFGSTGKDPSDTGPCPNNFNKQETKLIARARTPRELQRTAMGPKWDPLAPLLAMINQVPNDPAGLFGPFCDMEHPHRLAVGLLDQLGVFEGS
jgi:hypothetical protein